MLAAYAVEKILRRHPKAARNLRDRRDPHIPLASLGPGELDWMYATEEGEALLRQFLTVAEVLDVATNQNFGLGHTMDGWALSQ